MFDEAKDYAFKLAKEKGYVFVHPYEDEYVIAGQGTNWPRDFRAS